MIGRRRGPLRKQWKRAFYLPSYAESHGFRAVDVCVEGTLRSSYERCGVCFGGFRPTKHVEEQRLRAVTHFGVQAWASARGGST